jgi:hypothetical protein
MRGAYRPSHYNGLGGGSGVAESWPSVRVEHVESSGAGDAAEVGALLSVRAFLSLGELTPDDVHVQVLHGKIDCNDVLTGVTVQDLELAESCVGGLAPLCCRSSASCTKGRSLPRPPGHLHREDLRTGIVHAEYQVAFGGPPVRCGNPRRVGRAGRGARRVM